MRLTGYGRREWMAILIVTLVAAVPMVILGWWWGLLAVVVVALALLSFFRDPLRRTPPGLHPGDMLSPADGRVSKVFEVEHHDAVEGPATVVRIFLSVFNVHVNRSPCAGRVESITHRPGRYLDARSEESARVNESNLVVLRTAWDDLVGVRQVSGAVARRIVCPLIPGDRLERGQRFGMIKFGSTTELILARPETVEVRVREGQVVKGGLTILASVRTAAPVPAVVDG